MYQAPQPIDHTIPRWLRRFYRKPRGRFLDRAVCFIVVFGILPLYGSMIFYEIGPLWLSTRILFGLLFLSVVCRTLAEALPKRWTYQASVLRAVGLGGNVLAFVAFGTLWLGMRLGML